MLHKIIYKLGVTLRSPELIKHYNKLKESETWNKSELEKHQVDKMKFLLKKAYSSSEFYKKKFDQYNVDIERINSLEDFKNIPILTKKELLKYNKEIQNKNGYRKLFFSETSGSTGEALAFYRNSNWDAGHRAAQLRGYSWFGINPWEPSGYFWGYSFNLKKKNQTRFTDYLLNRFRLFSYDKEEIKKYAKKLEKAKYLEGYSSMIYEISKLINEEKMGPYDLKMVKGTSEKIFDSYQEESLKAFNKKIISEYGAAETGIIAFECKKGNMHITMENVIVEVEDGEILVTNLLSESFPIIRYKLGDSVVIDERAKCECGMEHSVIKEIVGRVGKLIYGNIKKYPSLTFYNIFKNLAIKHNIILNYQVIQKNKGEVEVFLDKEINKETRELVKEEFFSYFSNDICVIFPDELIQREYNGKFKDFVSMIN